MKHTPGPWETRKYSSDDEEIELLRSIGREPVQLLTNEGQRIVMAGEKRVAAVDCHTKYKRGEAHKAQCHERDANALLIAAAPDLYRELEHLVRLIDPCIGSSGIPGLATLNGAKAALAKARGDL
jgi:hypothetical protein